MMPQNCSQDAMVAMEYMDSVYDSGNATQIAEMQGLFGPDMANLTYPDFTYGRACF